MFIKSGMRVILLNIPYICLALLIINITEQNFELNVKSVVHSQSVVSSLDQVDRTDRL